MSTAILGLMGVDGSTQYELALAAAVVAGLLLGSFLNVCIVRLPQHRSVVTPRSECPGCRRGIRALDNIPILSWLLLRGRCRSCGASISLQYPLVEMGTAALFAACIVHAGVGWQALIDATGCFFLLGLAVMDAQTMLLPDAFTLTGIAAAVALRALDPGEQARWRTAAYAIADALAGAALLLLVWGVYWVIRRRSGVGMGDVKLLAMVAAFLALPRAAFAYFAAVVAAALFAIAMLIGGRVRGTDRIPFGAFLAGAGILAIFAGTPAIAWYMRLFR